MMPSGSSTAFSRGGDMRLEGNRVALGVTGGISAYKACELVRLLVKSGIEVKVIMTEDATRFVTPETFRVLSGNEVLVDTFDHTHPSRVEHVMIPEEVDLLVVAPATANTIAKFANGIADNMLTCAFLANAKRTLVCPAMNSRMYRHPATRRNIEVLKSYGVAVLEPEAGALACGDEGKGRLPAPERIHEEVIRLLSVKDLEGKRVLVTAGPTREFLDPVRFISNPSSGKMGFALAKAASRRGAEVVLVSGPTWLETPVGVERVDVVSAQQMFDEVVKRAEDTDVFIMSAAVADYRPKVRYDSKIKKESVSLDTIPLERTPDIIAHIAKNKRAGQFVVGFAAETDDVVKNATDKMKRKNMDMIVANVATQAFQKDTNRVVIVLKSGELRYLPEMSKEDVADEILDEVVIQYQGR